MEKNSRLMKDLNYNNKILVNLLNKRMEKSKLEKKIIKIGLIPFICKLFYNYKLFINSHFD